jgi:hypothetical protein
MSENTPKDTEISAMNAWLRLPKNERPPYIATGVPVRDTSSQLKPK